VRQRIHYTVYITILFYVIEVLCMARYPQQALCTVQVFLTACRLPLQLRRPENEFDDKFKHKHKVFRVSGAIWHLLRSWIHTKLCEYHQQLVTHVPKHHIQQQHLWNPEAPCRIPSVLLTMHHNGFTAVFIMYRAYIYIYTICLAQLQTCECCSMWPGGCESC
jgi:hypothetical protein